MPDKDKEAYWKGRSDSNKESKDTSLLGAVCDLLRGPYYYQPTSNHKEAYNQGWKDAEKDRKK